MNKKIIDYQIIANTNGFIDDFARRVAMLLPEWQPYGPPMAYHDNGTVILQPMVKYEETADAPPVFRITNATMENGHAVLDLEMSNPRPHTLDITGAKTGYSEINEAGEVEYHSG